MGLGDWLRRRTDGQGAVSPMRLPVSGLTLRPVPVPGARASVRGRPVPGLPLPAAPTGTGVASGRAARGDRCPVLDRGERRAAVPVPARLLAEPVPRRRAGPRRPAVRPGGPHPWRDPPGLRAFHLARGPLLLRAARPQAEGEAEAGPAAADLPSASAAAGRAGGRKPGRSAPVQRRGTGAGPRLAHARALPLLGARARVRVRRPCRLCSGPRRPVRLRPLRTPSPLPQAQPLHRLRFRLLSVRVPPPYVLGGPRLP